MITEVKKVQTLVYVDKVTFKCEPKDYERFKAWLYRKHLTVAEYARRCEMNDSFLRNIFGGRVAFTQETRSRVRKGGYRL